MPTETISEKLLKINQIKSDLKTQIEAKGVTVGNADFEDYPGLVEDIPSGSSATLITKSITQNGTYSAQDDNADGFSSVTVTVPTLANKFKSLVDGSITSVAAEDLDGISTIRANAFQDCINLETVSLPQSVKKIDASVFTRCRNLLTINTQYVNTFQTQAFQSCEKLEYIDFSSIEDACIAYELCLNCYSLKKVILPASINRIMGRSFRSCRALQKFIILSTTVIILDSVDALQNTSAEPTANYPIYVHTPDSCRVATNWSALASRIFPLVSTVADLANIDTTIYTNACVIGADNSYKEYTYDGSQWNEVT